MRKVLLVDDAESIHSLVQVHFADEAMELHSAFSGQSALQMADALRPDLILLDVDMPDMDGFEVCRRLRGNPFTMNIPIIFLTASAATAQMVLGLELGANDYITKPFEPEALVARTRAALRVKQRMDLLAGTRVSQFMSEALEQGRRLTPVPRRFALEASASLAKIVFKPRGWLR